MIWLLILLAASPFAAKGIGLAWFAHNYVAQSSYKIFQLGGPVWWRRSVEGRRGLASLWPIDEPWPRPMTWGLAVCLAALSVGAAAFCIPWLAAQLNLDVTRLRQDIDARFHITPWRAVAVVVFLTAINSGLEELHFRVWLDRELSKRLGNFAGIVVSAAAFAAMHLFIFAAMPGVAGLAYGLLFVALALIAVVWSLLARRPGGIHAAWLSHALTDAGLLTWGLFWLGYF
jgi:membrane protease YdiL (CAAX protease family)